MRGEIKTIPASERNENSLRGRVEASLIKYGPMSSPQIAALLEVEQKKVTQSLLNLERQNRVSYEGAPGKRIYTAKVKKTGVFATKNKSSFHDRPVFTGVDWSASIQRPGCQDALACPSRRGNELVPYRAPIINASSMKLQSNANELISKITQWK